MDKSIRAIGLEETALTVTVNGIWVIVSPSAGSKIFTVGPLAVVGNRRGCGLIRRIAVAISQSPGYNRIFPVGVIGHFAVKDVVDIYR